MDKYRWLRSGLHRGDRVRIQESMLITGNGKRLIKTEYVDETERGIRLRLFFEPGPCTEDPKWDYDVFIAWPELYCGNIRLKTFDGRDIRAERLHV